MSEETKHVEHSEKCFELSKISLHDAYWDFVLINGKAPHSVYHFCKKLEITEKDFYKFYSSFQAIEEDFWSQLVIQTRDLLEDDSDYHTYDVKGKSLAFFYTFFEKALDHRSKFLVKFPCKRQAICDKSLCGMKEAFDDVMKRLVQGSGQKESSFIPTKIFEESYRGAWPIFLHLIDFWIKDTSENFQDTDSLIEKMVRFGNELTNFSIVDAAIDLAKFTFSRGK